MVFAEWEDNGITVGDGSNNVWFTPSEAEELIDCLRRVLSVRQEEQK